MFGSIPPSRVGLRHFRRSGLVLLKGSIMLRSLVAVLLLIASICSVATAAEKEPRPNILWVTCEDLSPILGCFGDKQANTPCLDKLATEGVRYTNAFASASVCSPARSCLITGVYPSSLGTMHLRSVLPRPQKIRCFTEYLREAGGADATVAHFLCFKLGQAPS